MNQPVSNSEPPEDATRRSYKACHCATEGEASKVKVSKVKQERKRESGNGKQLGKFDKAHHCATEGEAVRVKLMKLKVSTEQSEIEEIESEQSET